ncbi:unnamed protein product [Durusdinium trenchii]|uniref:Secreted protein n=1 Tax=Durusdinium trenchii TaxID=1381693 RepID=A0ABP0JGG8_9DINO
MLSPAMGFALSRSIAAMRTWRNGATSSRIAFGRCTSHPPQPWKRPVQTGRWSWRRPTGRRSNPKLWASCASRISTTIWIWMG